MCDSSSGSGWVFVMCVCRFVGVFMISCWCIRLMVIVLLVNRFRVIELVMGVVFLVINGVGLIIVVIGVENGWLLRLICMLL